MLRRPSAAVAVALLVGCGGGDREIATTWSSARLTSELHALERTTTGLGAAEIRQRLRDFARRSVGVTIEAADASVIAVYERDSDWLTRPYFAVGYDPAGYLYLEEVDPSFQRRLAHHRHWASVAVFVAERQLMFELALDPARSEGLRPGARIDLACELAAVIRGGKSVYCRALAVQVR